MLRKRFQRRWLAFGEQSKLSIFEHPYLLSKGVSAFGVRQHGKQIVVPMRDAQKKLWSLQYIGPKGRKRFTAGGRVDGLFHLIGDVDDAIYFAEGYSTGGIQQTWPVHGKYFMQLLGSWYYQAYKKPVKSDCKKEVCEILAGFAYEEGRRQEVFLRVGTFEGKHYIDLCNDRWQVVEVSEHGWRVLDQSPVKFIRTRNMQALPVPVVGGDIQQLWRFVNVAEKDRLLVLAWLIECFRENTQNPVLEVLGGYGSGKSNTLEVFRSMVDPNSALLRAMSNKEEDLFVSAQSNWILTYENVSVLSDNQLEKARDRSLNHDEVQKLWNGVMDVKKLGKVMGLFILMVDAGLTREERNLLQNHAQAGIDTKHYNRHDQIPEKREAIRKYDAWLTKVIEGKVSKLVDIEAFRQQATSKQK